MKMKGQTLIEVLVALSILAVVGVTTAKMITSSLNNSLYAKNKTLATKYAQEGMEGMRELRNKNYSQFRAYTNTYCLKTTPVVLSERPPICDTPNVVNFIRTVDVQQSGCGINTAKVIVMVSWNDGKCSTALPYCNKVSHDSCMSTVNPIQSP